MNYHRTEMNGPSGLLSGVSDPNARLGSKVVFANSHSI